LLCLPLIHHRLDNNTNAPHFTAAFELIRAKVEDREYHSVTPLAEDIASALREKAGVTQNGDTKVKLTPEQKYIKQRATVILSKVKPMLMDAARKEAQLAQKVEAAVEEDAQRVLVIMQSALKGGPSSIMPSVVGTEEPDTEAGSRRGSLHGLTNGHSEAEVDGDVDMLDASHRESDAPNNIGGPTIHEEMMQAEVNKLELEVSHSNHEPNVDDANESVPALSNSGSTNPSHGHVEPPTPPRSEKDLLAPLAHGGIPWYLEHFDVQGTTVHEEEWPGRDVLRAMSEQLSELDEDAVNDLVDEEMQDSAANKEMVVKDTLQLPVVAVAKKKAAARRKRAR
jgi:NuA3 HAT complex component NTO1